MGLAAIHAHAQLLAYARNVSVLSVLSHSSFLLTVIILNFFLLLESGRVLA